MNLPNPRIEQELKEGVRWLALSEKNQELLRSCILLEERDDALLASVEPQTNFHSLSQTAASYFYIPFMRIHTITGKPVMERLLEFLWAAGGTSVAGLLSRGSGFMSTSDSPQWRGQVLGTAPAAVLVAANAFANNNYTNNSVRWLLSADPAGLHDALDLCTTIAEDHAYALIAAAMLRREEDAQLHGALVGRTVGAVRKILFGLQLKEIQEMERYIEAGDPNAPVPVLPSIQLPAVDIHSAQNARWMATHLLRSYAMAALLTADRDSRMLCALRFCLMLFPRQVFYDAVKFLPRELMPRILELLAREIPGGRVSMLLFGCSYTEVYKTCREICVQDLQRAMEYANPEQYILLLEYEKKEGLSMEEIRVKLAMGLSKCTVAADEQDAYGYLMEQGDLSDAVARLRNIRPGFTRHLHSSMDLLREYVLANGLDTFALRCVTFSGLVFVNPCLFNLTWMEGGKTSIDLLNRLLQQLCENGLPAGAVLTICDKVYEHSYWEEHKVNLRKALLTIGAPDRVEEFARVLTGGSVFMRTAALELLAGQAEAPGAKEAILSAASDSSKQVKELLGSILPKHPEWAEDYNALLKSKKAAVRLMAVEVLGRLNLREPLEKALEGEKNARVADAIRAVLGAEGDAPGGSGEELAAKLLKGNKLKKLGWLLEKPLPKLHKADGTEVSDDIRNAILLSYCELGRVGRSETAAGLAAELDASDLQRMAVQVYDIWFADGAQAKHKWVLSFAAVFGGEAMTERLRKAIHDWPEHQRGAIACDAVMALALSTDPAAIVIVDAISRKFKFRQVKQAAAAALENAAQELGISAEELADRIVPDLGFGKDGRRVFDYGKRSFTVRLTPTLELEITNDQGKAVKNMPAPGKTDDPKASEAYEAFKTMKKQIKTTVTAQRARLETALSSLRCWDTERWTALFVDNPIMHQFAMSLIWGIYEDGALTDTFRYMEDGSFNTVDEEEYTLPDHAKIGLVHPVELEEDHLQAWKQQLEDYEIKQSIDQLDRPVHRLDPENAEAKALEDFGGKQLNSLSLSGKLLGLGWYRGSVQDGGFFNTFYREDRELGIGAELRFSGAAVGYDDGELVTVYDAVFYTGTIRRGSYVYDTIPDGQIVPLGQVPTRYYSEIVLHLSKATASSTETAENWREDR